MHVTEVYGHQVHRFAPNGRHLMTLGMPGSRHSGLFIDENDVLYAADSESGSVAPQWGHWTRGIRVGSARTGEVHYLIPDPQPDCRGTCTAEGVTVDRNGVIYGAEVGPVGGIKRYVRQ